MRPSPTEASAAREVRDERLDTPAAGLQAPHQAALRDGGEPVRRSRRVDQHHAPHPAGDGLRGDPSRAQPVGRGDRRLCDPGGCAGHRDLVLPGRARRVLQVHARPAARAWRRAHQGLRRRRRRDRARRDPRAARLRRRADLLARGRPEARPAGHDQRDRRCGRRRSGQGAPAVARRARVAGPLRPGAQPRAGHHRAGGRRRAAFVARSALCGSGSVEGPGAGHHRHRRRRQELADRRAGAALPPRPAGPAEDRDRLDRSVAAQVRRRIAGRPDPDERDPCAEHLHALARDPRCRQRDLQGPAGRDRRVQGRRIRSRRRRDLGHRPGRRRDRPARRPVAVRDDARIRRRVAAREDRHARFRRLRRDQQVRPQGRAGRAARRAQAVPAQPRGLEDSARGAAGLRDDRIALQRRRRDRALRVARGRAARPRPCAAAGDPACGRHAAFDPAAGDRSRAARALPRRDRGERARLSPHAREQAAIARERQQLRATKAMLAAALTPGPSPASGRGEQALTPGPSPASGRGEQALTPGPSPASGRGEQALTPGPSPASGRGEA